MNIEELFESFTAYAFRLEGLSNYVTPEGDEVVSAFARGENLPDGFNDPWVALIKAAAARGAKMERLRFVSESPTFYERLELEAAYVPGVLAGEDIRTLPRDQYEFPADFWAFDDKWIGVLNYGQDGEYFGADVIPATPDHLEMVGRWREVYRTEATPVKYN